MSVKKTFFLIILSVGFSMPLVAQEGSLVNMTEFFPEEIKLSGFTLSEEQSLTIEAKTITPRRNYRDRYLTYAWILDSETRLPVWKLSDAEQQDRDRHTALYKDELELKAGSYEVYYSTYPFYYSWDDDYWESDGIFSAIIHGLFHGDRDSDRHRYYDDLYDELYFKIDGKGSKLTAEEIEKKHQELKELSFVSFTQMKDEEFQEQIFRISEPVEIEVYALGEARRDGDYDFGSIINLKTRERVWQLTYRDSDHAGGTGKNRTDRRNLTLEPGIYKALYVSDDSHGYRGWNAAPPFDPSFWGLSIRTTSAKDKERITLLDSDQDVKKVPVIEFTKMRDEEYKTRGFTLKKALDLHIYALGEGRDDEMFDYGWIIDAKTRQKVWEMKYRDTELAGGASKNRLFDGIVRLEPGNYLAYYITDDSHAYHGWNASAPYDQKSWGMSVYVLDDNYRDGDVVAYDEEEDPNVLARLVRIRDHARKKSKFTLEKDGYVHIYAIGEGMDGDMYDYAWIRETNTGKIVWEMTYRQTERAGGAKKNRLFDDRIYLEKGDYTVYYETDDSHSFNDWNDRPPRDPFNWGVTISRTND